VAGVPAAAFEWAAGAGAGRFRLAGALSLETAAAVLARGSSAFAGERAVSLDLSGVTHADSAGLSVLLTWVGRARREGRTLAFTAIPDAIVRIARLCAVESMLTAAGA